jgi:hypothetical protein
MWITKLVLDIRRIILMSGQTTNSISEIILV